MDVRAIDNAATTGRSALHRAAAPSKLIAFACLLAAVVVQQNVLVVASVTLALAAVVVGMRLPARRVFGLAAYPAVFAVIFAFAAAPDVLVGALFVAKAVTAALAAVVLVFTTPYPQIFAPVQRIVPEIVGDAMLLTYRSIFLLAEKFDHLRVAVRLRSGLGHGHPLRAARATAAALGALLLYAFDLSQREYDIMRLRGYEGRLRATLPPAADPRFDAAMIAGAAVVLGLAVTFRLAWAALNPVSWLLTAAALLALILTMLGRSIRR